MFSTKKNVLEVVALLKAYNIKEIVLSPGSRNAPFIQTFSSDNYFNCHLIVDERDAAFYALGIILATKKPVAVCCTSGSALVNYHPAVSEAYYQQLPLIIISADRAPEWIDQMDGQTLRQPNIFGYLCKKSVNLTEIIEEKDKWYCNRLINDALIATQSKPYAPVQINVPISEPLFQFTETSLPEVRKINYSYPKKRVEMKELKKAWNKYDKKLIIIGQNISLNEELSYLLNKLTEKSDTVILSEHLGNCTSENIINNFDSILVTKSFRDNNTFNPDLLISFGGHLVSKRIKHFFRKNKPSEHWLISESNDVIDLFQSLTRIIEADACNFLKQLLEVSTPNNQENKYVNSWKNISKKIPLPNTFDSFGDISAVGTVLNYLPENSNLHLANSSIVRNSQLYPLNKNITTYCNRGVNGIEGSFATYMGFISNSENLNFLLIGDLSFFYGINSLWNIRHKEKIRIILFNNGGGAIFQMLPGAETASHLRSHIMAGHRTTAKDWVKASGLEYIAINNHKELQKGIKQITSATWNKGVIMEIFTTNEVNKEEQLSYYEILKSI